MLPVGFIPCKVQLCEFQLGLTNSRTVHVQLCVSVYMSVSLQHMCVIAVHVIMYVHACQFGCLQVYNTCLFVHSAHVSMYIGVSMNVYACMHVISLTRSSVFVSYLIG